MTGPATATTVDTRETTTAPGGDPPERAEVGHPFMRPARLTVLFGLVLALGLWRGLPILAVVGSILVMIFFHELGHFMAARRAGMRVTEFFIGFGPRIWSFRRGDVEYGIKAIPAGAYVKIIGMSNIDDVSEEDEPHTYRQKTYPQRMLVAVAGSGMHFLMALTLLYIAFVAVGTRDETNWIVDRPLPGSAAQRYDIRHGDRITSVAGVKVDTQPEMGTEARKHPNEKIELGLVRDGKSLTKTVILNSRMSVYGTVGEDLVVFSPGSDEVLVSAPLKTGVLAEAGLRDSDHLISVNGTAVSSLGSVRDVVKTATSGTLRVEFTHENAPAGASPISANVNLGSALELGPIQGFLGVGEQLVPQKQGFLEAVPATGKMFGRVAWASVSGLGHFFTPSNIKHFVSRTFHTTPGESHASDKPQSATVSATAGEQRNSNRMTSIVGAVVIGEQVTEGGWVNLLLFLAQLNIIIGIFNLVPLPPFDGGHVAIATYERIRELARRDGKRYFADFNKLMPVAVGVISVLLLIGMMAIYLDLADPVRL